MYREDLDTCIAACGLVEWIFFMFEVMVYLVIAGVFAIIYLVKFIKWAWPRIKQRRERRKIKKSQKTALAQK